jgi:hypothetical protein
MLKQLVASTGVDCRMKARRGFGGVNPGNWSMGAWGVGPMKQR